MADLPKKLQAVVDEIDGIVRRGEHIPTELAGRLYQQVNFDRMGITLQDVTWLCLQRPAEINNFCKGKSGFIDLQNSLNMDRELRYPVGQYKDGRSGLG